jgi:hypothetical protein
MSGARMPFSSVDARVRYALANVECDFLDECPQELVLSRRHDALGGREDDAERANASRNAAW